MLEFCVNYFALIICSFYLYVQLLNSKKKSWLVAADFIFALSVSVFLFYVRSFYALSVIPILIFSSFIYLALTTKTDLGLSVTTTILSFGIAFAFFLTSLALNAAIFELMRISISASNGKIFLFCVPVVQLLLCGIPWKFRRLKNGMPFLQKSGGGTTGILVSTVLLCCFIAFSQAKSPHSLFMTVPCVVIFLCGIDIFFWWRKGLQKTYLEKLRATEVQTLGDDLKKKEELIQELKQSNDFLAKVIHKDNKLIPAMELAVKDFLCSFDEKSKAGNTPKGRLLLEQLKAVAGERAGILSEYESAHETLPSTGIFLIDTLMDYMFSRARENGIQFRFTFSGSVKYMVEHIVSASDLRTLLADLIENAMIATRDCDSKKVLVSIAVCSAEYVIEVFDSGTPFSSKVLIDLGQKRATTHADTGGSGIGLLTVFEIVKNHQASLMIEEFSDEENFFTKKIAIRFDHLDRYIVKTQTHEKIRAISARKDLIVNL